MKETATILKIQKNNILLRFHEQEACKSCSSMFCKANERTFTAEKPEDIQLGEGDIVTVYLEPAQTIWSSFLVLIFPLILFILFFFLSQRVLGIEKEIVSIGIGVIGIAAGFLLSFFLSRKKSQNSMPRIIGKQATEGTSSAC